MFSSWKMCFEFQKIWIWTGTPPSTKQWNACIVLPLLEHPDYKSSGAFTSAISVTSLLNLPFFLMHHRTWTLWDHYCQRHGYAGVFAASERKPCGGVLTIMRLGLTVFGLSLLVKGYGLGDFKAPVWHSPTLNILLLSYKLNTNSRHLDSQSRLSLALSWCLPYPSVALSLSLGML